MASLGQRINARKRAAGANDSPAADARARSQYELMLAGLWQMRRDLKAIKSVQRKIDYKRDKALPQLRDYIDGVLDADTGAQNDVLMSVMVWRFDVGDLDRGLTLSAYALRHGLQSSDNYKRDVATIVADEVADRALEQLKASDAPDADTIAKLDSALATAYAQTEQADLHDQVRAKLLKAQGYTARVAGDNDVALRLLASALTYNARVGVKKDIEKLKRTQKQEAAAAHNADAQQADT